MDGITTHNPIVDVPELIPMEDYDPYKARLAASIRWLLTKAFGNNVPTDLVHHFYDDDKGSPQLTPSVMNALTSADVYCRACAAIFRADTHTRWEGHWSVMQALSRKGIYVVDANESAVTETLLLHTQPFKVGAHLAMMESLMHAYLCEVVTVERISAAVRRFASFNASSELPYHTEDSLVFWLNKVCAVVRECAQQDLVQEDGDPVDIPVVADLMKDVNDGCCLAALVSFYCPHLLPITEVAVKVNPGIADSLYNVQLVCDFCERHIPGALTLSLNDLFYGHDQLRVPLLTFLAELFARFEVHRLPIVRDTTQPYKILQDSPSSPPHSKGRPQSGRPLISNLTKKSFQQSRSAADDLRSASGRNPDLHNNAALRPRQPLLPRRLGRTNQPGDEQAPSRREDGEGMGESVRAWEDQRTFQDGVIDSSQDSARTGSTMLANVSMDSDMSLDMTTDSSIELSELEDTPRRGPSAPVGPVSRVRNNAVANPRPHTINHTGHGDGSRSNNNGQPLEPLLPAKLKFAKEKTSNHTKEVESGECAEKRSPGSPNKPPRSLAIKKSTAGEAEEESSEEEEFQTPSAENVPFFEKPQAPAGAEDAEVAAASSCPAAGAAQEESAPSSGGRSRQYEAFYVDTDNPPITSSVTSNGLPQPVCRGLDRGRPQAQSFTLHDHAHTPESAIAAGIPVVDGTLPKPVARRPASRDSATSSNKGAGPRSSRDQEISKLNSDSRNKEIKDTPRDSFFLNTSTEAVQRPDTLNVPKPIQVDHPGSSMSVNGDPRPSPKTSFAEIKKQKDSGEVSPVTYIHGSPMKNPTEKSGLKSAFHKVQPGTNPHGKQPKKTSFAALPNQTTWQESLQKSQQPPEASDSNRNSEETDSVQPMATELMSIRMRLEERRRQIETEKRRMELQWNKQRQRMGKQAFIAVITKGKGDGSSPEDGAASAPKKTPEGASGLKGVTDSGLGGSQTEGEPESMSRMDHEEEVRRRHEEDIRRRQAEQREKDRVERERRDREEQEQRERLEREEMELKIREERLQKEEEERERQELAERERREREDRERREKERREEERRIREGKERELERLREREREKDRLRKEMEDRERERQRELEKEVEQELERERKRQREIERDLEMELEREKTRQSQRDLELDRLREKQAMLEKQVEERLRERSESPAGSSDAGRSNRSFSREGIQSLLDGGKQRWLSRESTPEIRSRPKSYAAGEGDLSDYPESSYVSAVLSSAGGLAGAKAEYGQGLDKLNTSLSDLQGEIMRLSLEQDHIKNMVTEPRQRVESTPPKQVPSQPNQPPQPSRYYGMYPDPSGEPDVAGGIRSTVAGSTATSAALNLSASIGGHPGNIYGGSQSGQYPPTHPMYGVQQHPAYMPPTNQYGQYMPYQQGYGQAPPPQYPQHQGATTPLYHAPPGAPLYQTGYSAPPPGHQGQWPPHVQHPYGASVTSAPPGMPYSQQGHPMDYSHPAVAQTHTTGAHHSQQMSPSSARMPIGMTASGSSGGHTDMDDALSHGSLPSSTHSLPGGDEAGLMLPHHDDPNGSSSPLRTSTHSGRSSSPIKSPPSASQYHDTGGMAASPPGSHLSAATNTTGASTHSLSASAEAELEVSAENAGFFISFDSESPRRQKPKLPSHRKKGSSGGTGDLGLDAGEPPITKQPAAHPAESVSLMKRPQTPPQCPPQPVIRTPGLMLVIDADALDVPIKQDPSDMERKKQKILQQQVKRREEQEKKRQKAEEVRARKEERKRMQEEAVMQKKADDKARREDIFAKYLQRKADKDNTDEDVKPTPPIKKRERAKPKGQRPKSQPPGPLYPAGGGIVGGGVGGLGGEDHHSASSHSHSSQEDLCARGNLSSNFGGGPDQVDAGYPLAYGGLTHRRPPSPVWRKPNRPGLLMRRVLPGTKMHAESLPCRLDKSGQGHGDAGGDAGSNTEYHGPKLFVKPSQKSNRHIIGNAISHCCLAGTVNNGVKNKILDELQQADSKHFIILFRDAQQQFRSIYTYNPEKEEVLKLSGNGPKSLHNKMMERFYKYNSGSKSFSEIKSTKHLSVSIDAVTIQNHYWQKKPAVRKTGPNMY